MPSANSSAAAEPFIWQLLVLLLLLVSMQASPADDAVLAGRVTRVIDGDTLDVLLASGRVRVRLHGVDAPERDQYGGRQAQEWLRKRVQNRSVMLEPVSQDRYERMVAIVHLEMAIVNLELVRSGNAWAYRDYLRGTDGVLCDLEAAARGERQGLWQALHPRAPWEYRSTRSRGPFTDFSNSSAADCRKSSPRLRAHR
jgi:endonuclease YncB( thermonuclease family)